MPGVKVGVRGGMTVATGASFFRLISNDELRPSKSGDFPPYAGLCKGNRYKINRVKGFQVHIHNNYDL